MEIEISSDDDEGKTNKTEKTKGKGQGRKWDPVWQDFVTKMDENGKLIEAKCKSCNKIVSPRSIRMKEHLSKCRPQSKKPQVSKTAPASQDPCAPVPDLGMSVCSSTSRKQEQITKYTMAIGKDKKDKLDFSLGKFICATNSSFNILENKEFQQFISQLNPAYKLPSHEVMGSTILDKVHTEVKDLTKNELNGRKVCIMQDGWKTNQSDPIISHCVSTGCKSYFLDCASAGSNSKTAEFCLKQLQDGIKKANSEYGCDVVALVTDNCSSMQALAALTRIRLQIEAYGCNSHLLNLVGEYFNSKSLHQDINKVQTYMKNHDFVTGKLKEMRASRPVLSGTTRWNSRIDCNLNYLKNETIYITILRQMNMEKFTSKEKEKFDEVFKILINHKIYDDCKEEVNIFRPLCNALDKVSWFRFNQIFWKLIN